MKATAVNSTTATLEWKTPEKDGGVPITAYYIERREKKYGSWKPDGQVTAPSTTFESKKLSVGVDYYYRVCAENSEGKGPFADLKQGVVPSKEKSK